MSQEYRLRNRDTDGFVIPSLEIEQENANDDSQADTSSPKIKAEDNIHLGPHGGAPPSQLQDGNASSRKQSLPKMNWTGLAHDHEPSIRRCRQNLNRPDLHLNTSERGGSADLSENYRNDEEDKRIRR
ncbi:hypothetical protein DY000_02017730 [Brassica cretica]|uniref:Uncharacterized protein n=1 Tax=Brassica cretica TaxID=69181 RepID=A0ABQ7CPK8_BRACR|nr:hypothetical protein DY000_02017730 [Brassica cretica]